MENMEEMWKDVVGYEGLYEVSDMGRVRTVKSGLIRKPYIQEGYERISLSNKGERRNRLVHNLVLEAFVGPRPPEKEGAHGNGISTDNRLFNLRWATQGENVEDKYKHNPYCKRGHLLQDPNLNKNNRNHKWRNCKACGRENHYRSVRGIPFSDERADYQYERIMGVVGDSK